MKLLPHFYICTNMSHIIVVITLFSAHHNHHVHFPESVGLNTEIQVTRKGKSVDVHVGFLQYKHKYEINFVVPVAENATVSHTSNSPFIHICEVKTLGK